MDQGNLAILVDAKFEYTKQLINILKNNLFQGIKKIYNDAKEYSIEHDESDRTLKKFQFYLSEIPKWNQEMILSQVSDILEKSKCDWLEELITAVFVSHTRILTSINSGKAKKKINLNIPKIDHFIHQCYIDTARAFWKNPYLFDDTLNNYEYQRNRREAEGIIETSIQETIRKQLPVKHILKEYLGKDYETDDEEENIESEDYSNLRKMVKAEIENCSKEQLLGSSETPTVATETETETATASETKPDEAPAQASETSAQESVEAAEAAESVEAAEPATEDQVTAEPVTAESAETEPEKTPEVKEGGESENVSLKVEELNENNNGMKIETLDLDNVESLEDLTKLDLNEVDVKHPESEIIDLNNVEGLETLDDELNQVDLFGSSTGSSTESSTGSVKESSTESSTVNKEQEQISLNETPTLEKDVSNIKKIRIETSELNDEDRRKKEVLRKYGRKKNFQFFNDSLESDDEL